LALLVWLPLTAWLLWLQRRSRSLWNGAVGFTLSVFLLLFLARVFQTSYLIWPLAGGLIALLLKGAEEVEEPDNAAAATAKRASSSEAGAS